MRKFWWALLAVLVLYSLTHFFYLTSLPVFADEAIYIRWTQLIIDEPVRYAFFPLNDGKTPLFVWSMLPFQYIFNDQLFAGRFVSVLVGMMQVFAMGWVVRLLGGKKGAVILAMLMTTLLPFWYFHHRTALMDGMMTMWLTLALGGVVRITQTQLAKAKRDRLSLSGSDWLWVGLTGLFFGLALLSKLPAILFVPILGLSVFLVPKLNVKNWLWSSLKVAIALFIGGLIFLSLKTHPAFGQLFSRGSDFLFPLSEVLSGAWKQTIISLPNYIWYFVSYLSLPAMVMVVAGLFSPRNKRVHHTLLWLALIFFLPIALMGRVVYPRYLLPVSIFLTASAALAFENFFLHYDQSKNQIKKYFAYIVLILLLANMFGAAGAFVYQSMFAPNSTPFVSADKVQYLYEWSSGHGITETVDLIKDMAKNEKVAVATEGYFGTLPDALLLYFHRQDVSNINIFGIGQPITELPDNYLSLAPDYDRFLVVVNSHRMLLELDDSLLIAEFCRPDEAPCLQVWDVTNLVKSLD